MLEGNLPIRFESVGTRPSTSRGYGRRCSPRALDEPPTARRVPYERRAQMDLPFSVLHWYEMTLSGHASATAGTPPATSG